MLIDYWILKVGIGFVAVAVPIGIYLIGYGRTIKEAEQNLCEKLEKSESTIGKRKDEA